MEIEGVPEQVSGTPCFYAIFKDGQKIFQECFIEGVVFQNDEKSYFKGNLSSFDYIRRSHNKLFSI